MPLFRTSRQFPHRFTRQKRDIGGTGSTGDKTLQTELKKLVDTVAKPVARRVPHFTICLS
jgi:hypothetical protein